ncbi:DUF421 domain-containing protein [Feifania hominis]|uniref:DUF421 domain-containing protein n=1 Tax=Feifania hominis TaxID=2763660 RepID=A0A926HU62_9FIRM|nr:DUF421 domain-containing protein [Feifania hominis]MBC8535610.1 DUF421 domain-containing protein [Feifania hominis]
MSIVFVRTVILYAAVVIAVRVMGKKQIGELQPSELVVAILISEVAAIPMQSTNIPLLYGIIPIFTLVSCEIIVSFVTLKSPRLRALVTGHPSIVIANGQINQQMMHRLRFTIDDLYEELHNKDITHLEYVSYAILETNGKLTVFPVADYDQKKTQDRGFEQILVKDGVVNRTMLQHLNLDEGFVRGHLDKKKKHDVSDVFLMTIDGTNAIRVILKEEKAK